MLFESGRRSKLVHFAGIVAVALACAGMVHDAISTGVIRLKGSRYIVRSEDPVAFAVMLALIVLGCLLVALLVYVAGWVLGRSDRRS